MLQWSVYVLISPSGRTYVGSTTDIEKRLNQHNGIVPGGARSTRAGRPWQIGRVLGPYAGRGAALRVEIALKRWRGAARLRAPLPLLEGEEG